jgi:hypothetical protein
MSEDQSIETGIDSTHKFDSADIPLHGFGVSQPRYRQTSMGGKICSVNKQPIHEHLRLAAACRVFLGRLI